ncbi:MAG TPA: thiamine pyrophosphate-dependent enzyme [Chloroflexota bacterium]|nr:thiamine pyrophosphate-dependent enzyme [Chloroflexota bacterium]
MAMTAGDVLVEGLIDWGVDTIFGMPGDGINGIMESLRKRQDKINFIQIRHEEAAAFAACGYAKFTGRLGVCLATSGPGGIHLMNGLYDAKMDGQPVLAITGHHYHDMIDTHQQQDVNLDRVMADVSVYSTRVMGPAHVAQVTDIACRKALSLRGVSHINMPVDFQDMEVGEGHPSKKNKAGFTSDVFARSAGLPSDEDLRRAAEIINAGKKVVLFVGRGAIGATDELEQMADMLGAPIVKALLGKAAVPDDSPYTTGGHGLLGTGPSHDAINDCDTLFLIGTSFPYIGYLPKPGSVPAVQLDLDPTRIGLRYPVDVGLVGDSRRTLQALLPLLQRKTDRGFLETAQANMREWLKLMEERGTRQDIPMKPQVVAWELGKRLRNDAIVCSDSGTITTWWARQILAKRGQMHSCSGMLATMACGLPYAIGAQVAYPDRQVVAFVGDGGFTMLMGEMATAVKHKLPIKVFVIKNNTLGQIKWEQMVFLGNPEYECELHPIDFTKIAEACGATGLRLEDPKQAGNVIDQALNTPGPVLVEAVVDPFVPPMPSNIKAEQAMKFAQSLIRGEPNREKIALTIAGDKLREMV